MKKSFVKIGELVVPQKLTIFVPNVLYYFMLFSKLTGASETIHLKKQSYYDNDSITAESGALETRRRKKVKDDRAE